MRAEVKIIQERREKNPNFAIMRAFAKQRDTRP
jgi:hypothetical protein